MHKMDMGGSGKGGKPSLAEELYAEAKKQRKSGRAKSGGFKVGDRVEVKGKPHMPGQKAGTIKIVEGDTYGILFDGTSDVHKWYTGAELKAEGGAAEGSAEEEASETDEEGLGEDLQQAIAAKDFSGIYAAVKAIAKG